MPVCAIILIPQSPPDLQWNKRKIESPPLHLAVTNIILDVYIGWDLIPKLQIAKFSNYKTFPLFTDTTKIGISSASAWSNSPESNQYLAATSVVFHIASHNQNKLFLTVPSLRTWYNVWSDGIRLCFYKSQKS